MVNAIASIFFVGVDNRFGVAIGSVAMSTRLQLFTHGKMVVNLSVKNDPDCAVFVANGLVSGRQINNAEATHT